MMWDVLWSFLVFALVVAVVAGLGLSEKPQASKRPEEAGKDKKQTEEQ